MKEVEVRFRENFSAGRDSGSGMCFFEGEKKLISLYGGYLDEECLQPWREDTLVGIWCGTKGVVVACLLHAMQETGVGLDARIADFWPEFAQGGKREITLGQLLSHRSGLCALSDSTLQMLDKDGIVRCIEKQHPLLPPTAGPAYSPNLIGYALEEILRRLTGGETLSEYWRRVFGDPLGIELWIGLPESENVRVAATCAMDRSYFLERIAENLRGSKVVALLGRASLARRLWRENSAEPMPVVKTRNSAVLLRIWSFFGLLIARLPSFRGVEIFSSARDEAHSEFNFPVSSFQFPVSGFQFSGLQPFTPWSGWRDSTWPNRPGVRNTK